MGDNEEPWELATTHTTDSAVIAPTVETEGVLFSNHCTGISLVILSVGISTMPFLIFLYSLFETYYHYNRYMF